MSQGRMIAVVGPSGVGKDSVMAGIHAALPKMHLVRRVITRAPDLAGEEYDAVSIPLFHNMVASGAFAMHWRAHGLFYGIPQTVRNQLNKGTDCLANLSRTALPDAATIFDHITVLNITARPDTLESRLAARGRETPKEIARRLAQADVPLPENLDVIHLPNDGPLKTTVTQAVALLQRESIQ